MGSHAISLGRSGIRLGKFECRGKQDNMAHIGVQNGWNNGAKWLEQRHNMGEVVSQYGWDCE